MKNGLRISVSVLYQSVRGSTCRLRAKLSNDEDGLPSTMSAVSDTSGMSNFIEMCCSSFEVLENSAAIT